MAAVASTVGFFLDQGWRAASNAFLAPSAASSRRDALFGASVGLFGGVVGGVGGNAPADAAIGIGAVKYRPVTDVELKRIRKGYFQLEYLMANWNKVTRKCDKNQAQMTFAAQAGTQSPDTCIADPDQVRKYLGLRSTKEDLFNTQQLWLDIENTDIIPVKQNDEYQELISDFETQKQAAGDWAYTSSWGESNPGGGRDKVEDYLLRSKADAINATATLGKIVKILKLEERFGG